MSQVPVIYPSSGTTTPIKTVILTDETGTTNVQVVQLGMPDLGTQIVETLNQILAELRAQRIQDAQATNTRYETTQTLIDSTQ